jgi:hypothetical protein
MRLKRTPVPSILLLSVLIFPGLADTKSASPVLWRHPGSVASRDLFYGAGGAERQPSGRFTFVKEDSGGTTPKFIVRDQRGAEWKVKLGDEARPETAASRFVWAMGYFTDEDYIVPVLRVAKMPRLRRGQDKIAPDGTMRNARFERRPADAKKVDTWRWRNDPVVSGTRELNGLRVVMALLNNWDLKNSNTAVYESSGQQMYAVSDLGATFGSSGYSIPSKKSNLDSYMDSKFIVKVTPEYVDFNAPSRPALITVFALPIFVKRVQMRQLAKQIPIEDVRWITRYLAQLSPRQIRSAFRAAGYSPAEVEGFSRVIENRIAQLTEL